MRRAGKTDLTQVAIVKALRDIGASVQVLSAVGQGVPDLLAGWRGKVNVLLEVKTGNGKLTEEQVRWHSKWAGQVAVVNNAEDAIIQVLRAAGEGD